MKRRKIPFYVEVIKPNAIFGLEVGEVRPCYGFHWNIDFERKSSRTGSYVDQLYFLLWSDLHGWVFVEKCFVRPCGASGPEIKC